jgi:PKD repeat protein/DNA-binding transcriptional MerR regulator
MMDDRNQVSMSTQNLSNHSGTRGFLEKIFWSILGTMWLFSFEAQAMEAQLDKSVLFRAIPIPGANYIWNFPDGELTGEQVRYTFSQAGSHQITLTVKKAGEENSITKTVEVKNKVGYPTALPEVVVNGESYKAGIIPFHRGDTIEFRSDSIDGLGKTGTVSETWMLNGVTTPPSSIANALTDFRPYTVSLQVQDPNPPYNTHQKSLQIRMMNQTVEITSFQLTPQSENDYKRVKAEASVEDPDGDVVRYIFEILENGQTRMTQVSDQPFTYFNLEAYPGLHTYSARVRVQDRNGSSSQKNWDGSLTVESQTQNTAPTVSIYANPGNLGTTQTYFNFMSQAQDPDRDHLEYLWTLPDGSTRSVPTFAHRFQTPGEKTVQLSVSDGVEQAQASLTVYISASESDEIPQENQAPTVEITRVMPSQTGHLNTIFQLYAEATDANNDRLTYRWDLGNGAKMNLSNIAYRYPKPGTYTVSVEVSDGIEKARDEITLIVEDTEGPPNELYNEPAEGETDEPFIPLPEIQIDTPNTEISESDPFRSPLTIVLENLSNSIDGADAKTQSLLSKIEDKKDELEFNPFDLRDEFFDGKMSDLKDQLNQKIREFSEAPENAKSEVKGQIQSLTEQITQLKALGEVPESLEKILLDSRTVLEKKWSQATGDAKEKIGYQIEEIDRALAYLRNNPYLARSEAALEKVKQIQIEKEKELETTTDPEKKSMLSEQIQKIKDQVSLILEKPDEDPTLFLPADLIGTPDTKFFFYGQAPLYHQRALFFEWDLGENIKRSGQDINIRYKKPGYYLIRLEVTDGRARAEDEISIRILDPLMAE